MISPPRIRFSPSLSTLKQASLRAQLQPVLASAAPGPVYVDLAFDLEHAPSAGWMAHESPSGDGAPVSRSTQHLILALTYEDVIAWRVGGTGPCPMCARRAIRDGMHDPDPDTFSEYVREAGFPQLPAPVLYLIPQLIALAEVGDMVRLHRSTLQITREPLHPHMKCSCSAATDSASSASPLPLNGTPRIVGRSMRSEGRPDVDGLLSSYVGPIRGEFTYVDNAAMVNCLTRATDSDFEAPTVCGGRAETEERAKMIARCEAIERLHVAAFDRSESLPRASYQELGTAAVDPTSLIFRRPFARDNEDVYAPERSMYWTPAFRPFENTSVLVPAQDVWFDTQLLPGERMMVYPTTSGSALGGNVEEALWHALREAIERDAFLMTWYLRRNARRLDPDSVDNEGFQIRRLRIALEQPQYDIHFFDITSRVGLPTVWAMAVRAWGEGVKTITATAADIDLAASMDSALKELSGFFALNRMENPDPDRIRRGLHDPSVIRSLEDHQWLYGLDETFGRLAFLHADPRPAIPVDAPEASEPFVEGDSIEITSAIRRLIARIQAEGGDVLYKDLTHPAYRERGLACVKVLLPSFYPMYFSHCGTRFDVTDRLRRAFAAQNPHRAFDPDLINLAVHPLS